MKSQSFAFLCMILFACSTINTTWSQQPHVAAPTDAIPVVEPPSIEGVYVVTSQGQDYVGRATIVETQHTQDTDEVVRYFDATTYELTWKLEGVDEPYSGVGILHDGVLSATWSSGVVVYRVVESQQEGRMDLLGHYIEIGEPPTQHDETLRFFRELRTDEKVSRFDRFEVGQIVAANYVGQDEDASGWYYAKIVEKARGEYKIDYLLGDVPTQTVRHSGLSTHKIAIDDLVYAELEDGEAGTFYPLTVKSVPEGWEDLPADAPIPSHNEDGESAYKFKLEDDDGKSYERELKHIRFEASS